MKVAIAGATGYSGLELIRLLHQHPQVKIHSLHRMQQGDAPLSELYPHLAHIYTDLFQPFDPEAIMAEADLLFFATPSGVTSQHAAPFIEADFPVIDLSGDFRLPKAVYEAWYHKPAAEPEHLEKAHYGLAENGGGSGATFISNPGCYATAALLALKPLAESQYSVNETVIIDAKSGLSGAGKNPTATSHFSRMNGNMQLYKPDAHQHIPEIEQQLQKWRRGFPAIQFQTSLIPVTRGIFATLYIKMGLDFSFKTFYSYYQQHYQQAPFVRVQPEGTLPELKQVIGSNFCDIGLVYNERTGWLTIVSVIDNLVKGAAGQAIQNMNRYFHFDEQAGLDFVPLYP
ncbi:N-acetyl-gamma-glutamyl-phosphate reductase [Listeria costaricensis]|uniref:N-acetyl-gamma-glutamyl-phosphate reductase n=1 Tax=Listeria costaricensis TaxID=2026604 RepID=UPI000C06E41F|nr:N-acetyl-gamma-glutamyl-phosphate reductase [Listeria costaricensis]